MALYGKIGDQVVVRENINNVLNPQNNQPGQYNQNAGYNNVQNQYGQANTKIDFSRHIRLRFNNPASVDITSNANVSRDDFLKQLKEVRAQDLGHIQRILESCDGMKQDYSNYMALNVRLDDILKKTGNPNPPQNQQYQQHQQYQQQSQPSNQYSNPAQHLPPQQNKGYNDFDVQRFVGKFKCAKEMALGYLEAFGNYNEAERQFVLNTGWKG